MAEINLLNQYPKARRNITERKKGQEENRAAALRFGREYFDGTREQGYGGYSYDGRWQPIAQEIIRHYGLKPGDRVLDIGCAKGYLVKDLTEACPGLEVLGMDISEYALEHAPEETKSQLILGTADELPYEDNSFDAVLCINVLHNLERDRCIKAIQEIERIAPGRSYIQVDAYRNESERDLFLDWVLTAVTFGNLDFWREMFTKAGYTGDYFWTIIESDPDWVVTQ